MIQFIKILSEQYELVAMRTPNSCRNDNIKCVMLQTSRIVKG